MPLLLVRTGVFWLVTSAILTIRMTIYSVSAAGARTSAEGSHTGFQAPLWELPLPVENVNRSSWPGRGS